MSKVFKNWKWFEITFLLVSIACLIASAIAFKTSALACISAIFGIIGSTFNYKRNSYCFLFYILSGLIYAYVAFIEKNYGETILNVFYLFPSYLLSFVAFFKNRNSKENVSFTTRRITKKELLIMVAVIVVITVGYGFILKYLLSSNLPFVNSLATSIAICCIYMASRKIIDQWYGWTIYGIVLLVLWLITCLNSGSVDGIPFLVQNVVNTILNIYVVIKVLLLKKENG